MRPLWLPIIFLSFLASCQRVKEVVSKVKDGGESPQETSADKVSAGGPVDPAFEALVDCNDEGVIFRKDLPFPTDLTVRTTTYTERRGMRVSKKSALGTEAESNSGTHETVELWKREGDRLTLKIEKSSYGPLPAAAGAAQGSMAPTNLPKLPTTTEIDGLSGIFRNRDGKWKAENFRGGNFKQGAWLQEIEPGFVDLAAMAGALPHDQWFGKRRLREGTEMIFSGENIDVLFPGASGGKMVVVYEGQEAIGGHPCGRFTLHGDYRQSDKIGIDGGRSDMDVTVSSGTIWLSLIHPVVMRQEVESIVTIAEKKAGVSRREQGQISFRRQCEWKPGV